MRKIVSIILLAGVLLPAEAQHVLNLDSCRAMALRNNKQLGVSRLKQDVAYNTHKAAKTKYLPKVDAVGGYVFTSKEISILNDQQKNALSNIGTNVGTQLGNTLTPLIGNLAASGAITPTQAETFSSVLGQVGTAMSQSLNEVGERVRDAFRTDTRNMFMASVIVRQPLYMGGAITAANKMAAISEEMAANSTESQIQGTLYDIDQAYWMVVSLRQKERLANSYLKLVRKLDSDVHKMIDTGVATKADGLKVDVKVNEAEMSVTQVEDGLSLAKMYLCQLCGIPLDEDIELADENKDELVTTVTAYDFDVNTAMSNRPELKMLQNTVELSEQSTKLVRAANLPQVALTAGYLVSNPNVYNGFENKFSGIWNVGVMVRVPVWNWMEGAYKVRASKAATTMAALELSEVREKVELQVNQSSFRLKEANKRLTMAHKNTASAEENLRCANLGFKEGVMQITDVMAAQTAWEQAHSQRIDAEVDVKLAEVNLQKALGILN